MAREFAARDGAARLAFERAFDGARHPRPTTRTARSARACLALARRFERHARAPRLRQSDGDRLLGRPSAMFAAADFFDFRAHELARLRRWRLAFAAILARAVDGCFVRHLFLLSLS